MKNHAAIPVSTIPSSEPRRKARRTVVLRAGAGASCSPDGAELRAASSGGCCASADPVAASSPSAEDALMQSILPTLTRPCRQPAAPYPVREGGGDGSEQVLRPRAAARGRAPLRAPAGWVRGLGKRAAAVLTRK